MAIAGGGQSGSGLDRALQQALEAGLDAPLESGELYEGERGPLPDPALDYDHAARPWQMPLDKPRDPPGTGEPLGAVMAGLRERATRNPKAQASGAQREAGPVPAPAPPARETATAPAHQEQERSRGGIGTLLAALRKLLGLDPGVGKSGNDPSVTLSTAKASATGGPSQAGSSKDAAAGEKDALDAMREVVRQKGGPSEADRYKANFRFREELTGIVMIHGIGPQLAGQTLLDWTRPIITLVGDACVADQGLAALEVDTSGQPGVSDPVFKSNIDFSGETFPVLQLRIPRRTDVPDDDPRAKERRWIFTETWWASEVRPPTLRTMIGWLGEQGGVGRIVQGIQDNMLGTGTIGKLASVSLQAFISVIVSFVLLVFLALLGISRLIPFGPLKDAVALRLAASFITDWFGGARTLLRDPAQSANVRGRLVATIKALRAYGCRNVVIVAHSGGTMVTLMTLTDPAYPRLQVEKLITIGEALNLGWRLEDANPDEPPPTPPAGNRMRGDMAVHQPHLKWRDFWATHDPAPSGPPRLPTGMTDPGGARFTAERVYNRMNIGEDHGGYWDNDEQFLIPLIREIDVATGDRTKSRFYDNQVESNVRARRKERVALLSLWRRGSSALPVMAILGAAILSSGDLVRRAGDLALQAFGLIPGSQILSDAANGFANDHRLDPLWQGWYGVGVVGVGVVFLLLLLMALLPGRVDRLWLERPISRVVLVTIDVALGIGALVAIVIARILGVGGPAGTDVGAFRILLVAALVLILLVLTFLALGRLGREVRGTIEDLHGSADLASRTQRDLLIVLSAGFLGLFLLLLIVVVVGFVLVFIGTTGKDIADETRRLVLGGIVVLLGFQLLARLGTWRWDSWDVRERRALRRRPLVYPFRYWTYILAAMLTTAAVIATFIVALRLDGALGLLGGLVLAIVVLSVGKDVVDNDIETGFGGGGPAEGGGAPVIPGPPGPAAGSSAA